MNPSRLVGAAVVLALGVSIAPEAHAKCAMAGARLAPASGKVPPKPVLRLLLPSWVASAGAPQLVARSGGRAVPVTVHADARAPGMSTFGVAVAATSPGPLTIDLMDAAGGIQRSWSLDVDAACKPPASSAATIATGRVATSWTCSHQLTQNLRFAGDAPAYRVLVADSAAGFAQARQVVLPHDPGELFALTGSVAPSPTADLALGFVNCFGETFAWGTVPVWIRVLALLPDGSEQPVNAAPVLLTPP